MFDTPFDRTGSLVALAVRRTPHCLPLFTDPSVSPRSNRSSSANFAFSSAIIARSRSRTSLRPTCFILVSSARSCALTASPAAAVCALSRLPSPRSVGIRSICSNFCNPSRVTRSSSGFVVAFVNGMTIKTVFINAHAHDHAPSGFAFRHRNVTHHNSRL